MSDISAQSQLELEETLQPIPDHARTNRVLNQFWIWCGANVAPIMWVLGALGIQMGLSLRETILVIVIGNAVGMSLFGWMVLLGPRGGAPGIILSRYILGRRGNYLPSVVHTCIMFLWLAVNTWVVLDLIMALLGALGIVDPNAANVWQRVVTGVLLMAVQVGIALAGYRMIAAFERWTVPVAMVVMVAMTIAAWFFMGVDWGYVGIHGQALTGAKKLAAMSSIMTAIGIGWGMTWFMYADDYSRFVAKDVSKVRLFLASAFGQYLPTVWLGVLGATLATHSLTTDPGKLIVDFFGVLAIPVLFMVIHGPIATNILNIYSASISVQASDLKISRKWVTIVLGVGAVIVMLYLIFHSNLGNVLSTFLSASVAWITPWAAVMFVHYYWILRNREIPTESLFAGLGESPLPAFNWAGYIALFAGIFCAWAFMFGGAPILQGPISRDLGDVDYSWILGLGIAAIVYFILGPIAHRRMSSRIDAFQRARGRPGLVAVAETPRAEVQR